MATPVDDDFLFKFILIGDSGVGKSSILLRFSDNTFSDSYLATIGVDFKIRTLDLQSKTVKCQILDTAGQERFRTISSAYYKGAHGIILVYDITDKEIFKNIENWLTEAEKYADEDVVKMLVGNKNDLEEQRSVNESDGQQMAKTHGISFLEASAKNACNVEKVFETIAEEIIGRIKKQDDVKPIQNEY